VHGKENHLTTPTFGNGGRRPLPCFWFEMHGKQRRLCRLILTRTANETKKRKKLQQGKPSAGHHRARASRR
jgi:hypothetical protein